MKKIIVAEGIRSLFEEDKTYLHRLDVQIFSAATNDEILTIHRAEKANLIITLLDMPGIRCETLFTTIRKDAAMRAVSLLLLSGNSQTEDARASRCKPNAVLHQPVEKEQLLRKTGELLDIPWRGAYRVLLSVKIEGQSKDSSFFCRSENISISGLLIETERALKKGDRLTCSFFLPGSKKLIAECEVVRIHTQTMQSNLHRFGIVFLQLAPDIKSAIEAFVEIKYQQASWMPVPSKNSSGQGEKL